MARESFLSAWASSMNDSVCEFHLKGRRNLIAISAYAQDQSLHHMEPRLLRLLAVID
jgi:hypothetical protein